MSPNFWNLSPQDAKDWPPMLTTTNTMLHHLMADAAVDDTISLVATMVGAPRDSVAKIAEAGLPLMADAANEDPWVFKAMYAWSRKPVAAPTPAYYAKLGKNAAARQAMAADFSRVYGDYAAAITRDAGVLSGAAETLSRHVLAAMMPTLVKAVGKANTNVNEMGFGRQLRFLTAPSPAAGSVEARDAAASSPAQPSGRSAG